jgi:carbon-monoxide dehydrogenase medium subunit
MDYVAPSTVEEACAEWAEVSGSFYMAGGTDLLPQMRQSRHEPSRLVDVKRIERLKGIRTDSDGKLAVGAAVSLAEVASHPEVNARYPLLAECCTAVGSYPLRNRATMAGNICNASPAADTSAALLALDAEVKAAGPNGERVISIGELFAGPGRTTLERGELVTEIALPAKSAGCRGGYLRLSRRRAVDLATAGVLVARHAEGGHRVCLIAVAPTPLRVVAAEDVLDRVGYTEGAVREAAEAAGAAASPIDDVRGSAEYRKKMIPVLVSRGIGELAAQESKS